MFRWLTQHLPKRATKRSADLLFDKVSVHLTADGFELHEAERMLTQVKWVDVLEARAFKRDLLTTDLICVMCRIGRGAPNHFGVEVHEEMPGFVEWMNALPAHLAGVDADWYGSVMLPPMKTCERVIWKRGN